MRVPDHDDGAVGRVQELGHEVVQPCLQMHLRLRRGLAPPALSDLLHVIAQADEVLKRARLAALVELAQLAQRALQDRCSDLLGARVPAAAVLPLPRVGHEPELARPPRRHGGRAEGDHGGLHCPGERRAIDGVRALHGCRGGLGALQAGERQSGGKGLGLLSARHRQWMVGVLQELVQVPPLLRLIPEALPVSDEEDCARVWHCLRVQGPEGDAAGAALPRGPGVQVEAGGASKQLPHGHRQRAQQPPPVPDLEAQGGRVRRTHGEAQRARGEPSSHVPATPGGPLHHLPEGRPAALSERPHRDAARHAVQALEEQQALPAPRCRRVPSGGRLGSLAAPAAARLCVGCCSGRSGRVLGACGGHELIHVDGAGRYHLGAVAAQGSAAHA
mmetsp:Transcript_86923/g.270248  ORF Transcript_86923/g.270248 Transcript_86923/m.270248 type:complete len:389 (-) Transcript_86923:46-1212(-)